MSNDKIRVGMIGVGGWARYGHIPALQSLDEFRLIAVASRTQASAKKSAAEFDMAHAFDDELALINHPDVDLVVILAPAPEHARLAKAAIGAGKDVYSEWPLTTNTADSEELLALAEARGVRHIVGLQRRFGPSVRYTRDIIKQGYVGKVRSARMSVSTDAFGPTMPGMYSWSFDVANFSHPVSVYTAHFGDMLFQSVGYPAKLTAIVQNQFPFVTIEETGEQVPTTRPDAAMIIGTLESGALFSIQVEGGQSHRTGIHIDITGTEGVLQVTNALAFQNKEDNLIQGMHGEESSLSPISVPAKYRSLALSLDASALDLAYLYAAYARDRKEGTSEASNFKDAVQQHQLIDRVFQTSEAVFG